MLRLWVLLPALHDGGDYQTHHNHGPLSQGIDGDVHQQLHLGGLGEGCVDRTTWCLSSLEWSSLFAVSEYGMAFMVWFVIRLLFRKGRLVDLARAILH